MRREPRFVVPVVAVILVGCVGSAAARDSPPKSWPGGHGPSTAGTAAGDASAVHFTGPGSPAWRAELPGAGCSTPIVGGGAIIVTTPTGEKGDEKETVVSGDWSGKERWTNLQERFGEDTLWWEIGTSPILTKDHVVVAVMREADSCVAAPQKKDGSIVWSCGGFHPEQKKVWLVIASPVVAGDVAVVPYGRGNWLAGVRLGVEGDVAKTHRIWNRNEVGTFVPSPATGGDSVYVVRDRGEVVCVDANSAETTWSGQLPKHSAKYYGSSVVADRKIYTTREDGKAMVAKVAGAFETLAENDMGEKVIASPVVVNRHILLRGQRHLFCVARP